MLLLLVVVPVLEIAVFAQVASAMHGPADDEDLAALAEDARFYLDGGDTLVSGPITDQAALHGLLRRVRDLGMALVSVGPVEPEPQQGDGE